MRERLFLGIGLGLEIVFRFMFSSSWVQLLGLDLGLRIQCWNASTRLLTWGISVSVRIGFRVRNNVEEQVLALWDVDISIRYRVKVSIIVRNSVRLQIQKYLGLKIMWWYNFLNISLGLRLGIKLWIVLGCEYPRIWVRILQLWVELNSGFKLVCSQEVLGCKY